MKREDSAVDTPVLAFIMADEWAPEVLAHERAHSVCLGETEAVARAINEERIHQQLDRAAVQPLGFLAASIAHCPVGLVA